MKSKYVELMELRKLAVKKGKKKEADLMLAKAIKMVKAGEVTPEELQAGAYI